MMEVVLNRCFGWYRLSALAYIHIAEMLWKDVFFFKMPFIDEIELLDNEQAIKHTGRPLGCVYAFDRDIRGIKWSTTEYRIPDYKEDRTNPIIVETVKFLWVEASTYVSDLQVVTIPDGIDWEIQRYDGMESIVERHRVRP